MGKVIDKVRERVPRKQGLKPHYRISNFFTFVESESEFHENKD